MRGAFDQYAEKYDAWFLENKNVLYSELKLVAYFLKDAGEVLSVGCGSGIFESLLAREYGIEIKYGIEPSRGMAEIAIKRGMNVEITSADMADFGEEKFNTVLFNGTTSYMPDLISIFKKTHRALKPSGRAVVIDVPKESSYGILYNLAKALGTWDHPLLEGVKPKDPYPIEFVNAALWKTTSEKTEILKKAGFISFEYAQTLTKHPLYSDNTLEEPKPGYDCGDYVAVCAHKK
ncbi:class I SAM-dependent methyltransferase [candidate division WOR-3 bacterium]|nr:class I SAM-dependent methyltransferase [candidate division WOR-3 bacterium]